MESASGPSRHSSVSPHAARRTPYARPATLEEGVAKQLEKRGSGLLGSLMRKGLGWIVGNHQQPTTAARGDEEEAVESRRGGLSRSATMPAIADVNGSPAARPMRRYAPPSVPASLSARSSSPDRPDARRRTGHSTLNLPNSSSSSTFGASRSYGNLRSANESTIFAPIPSIGPSPTDPYHTSTAYLKSNSPFASSGPSMHNLQLRSPSPGVPSPPRSASGGQALYPHVPNSRRRGPSPLNPASERSYAGSAMGRPMAWSPTRGGFSGSRAGSSIAGSSRRGDVFGRGSEVDGIPTVPKNEAERILNVLENLRTPFGGPARHSTRHINVPAAVPSGPNGDLGYSAIGRSTFISPYRRRQESEREERQEQRRSTLSEALRQRDLDVDQHRRAKRKDGERQQSKLRQRIDRGEALSEEATPRRRVRSKEAAERPTARRRTRAQVNSPPPRDDDMQTSDREQEDKETPPKRRKRGGTPRLPSPGRQTMRNRSKSPAPPVPTVKSPPPAPKASTSEQPKPAQQRQQSNSLRPGKTHTTRQHVKASTSTFSADDDDEPADYEALKKVEMPKFAFPTNFTFGSSKSDASAPPLPASIPTSFAAPAPLPIPPLPEISKPKVPVEAEPFSTPAAPAAFSFAAPSGPKKDESKGPATNPFAAFTASPVVTSAPAAPAANPFASFTGFGAAPKAEDAKSAPGVPGEQAEAPTLGPKSPSMETEDSMVADEEPERTPEPPQPAQVPPASETPMPAFGFVAPSAPSKPFSFGGGSDHTPAVSTPFTGFGQAAAPISAAPAAPAASARPPFTFGAPAATTSTSEAIAATSAPSPFAFNKPTDPPTSTPFAFGKPAETPAANSFGFIKPVEASTPSLFPAVSKPSEAPAPFTFGGKANGIGGSAAPAFGGFGATGMEASKSADSASSSQPATASFFASAPPTANGPAPPFGSGPPTPAANPFAPSNAFPAPSAPAHGFGQQPPASNAFGQPPAAPASNPFGAFGATSTPAPSSTAFAPSPAPASSGFGFGQASSQPSFGFGAAAQPPAAPSTGFIFGQPAAGGFNAAASAPPSAPAFGFGGGTASGTTTPFTPPAVNGAPGVGGFPFGAPTQPNDGGASLFNVGSGDVPTSPTGARKIRGLPNRRGGRK